MSIRATPLHTVYPLHGCLRHVFPRISVAFTCVVGVLAGKHVFPAVACSLHVLYDDLFPHTMDATRASQRLWVDV